MELMILTLNEFLELIVPLCYLVCFLVAPTAYLSIYLFPGGTYSISIYLQGVPKKTSPFIFGL